MRGINSHAPCDETLITARCVMQPVNAAAYKMRELRRREGGNPGVGAGGVTPEGPLPPLTPAASHPFDADRFL